MAFQTVFKRYEIKYMITLEQKQKVLDTMKPYIKHLFQNMEQRTER